VRVSIKVKLFIIINVLLILFAATFIGVTSMFLDDFFESKYEERHIWFYNQVLSKYDADNNRELSGFIRGIEKELKGFIVVFEQDGRVIESTSPSLRVGDYMPRHYPERLKLGADNNVGDYVVINEFDSEVNENILTLVGNLPDNKMIELSKPFGFVAEAVEIINKVMLSIVSIILVLGFVLAYFTSLVFTKPIIKINKSVKAIANRDFDHKLDIKNKDELGDLGNTVNEISGQLRDFIDEVETQNDMLIQDKVVLEDMNKQLHELSETDVLTKLNNRLKIDRVLEYEVKRAKVRGSTFSIIIADMDHFKLVNDTYGHLAGDEVLKDIAMILTESCRNMDVVGRWGGEEFIIVLPDTIEADAINVAEKFRKSIEEYEFEDVGHKTASFGVGEYNKEQEIDTLVKNVDDALYRAKENGRNRVEIAK